MTLPAGVRRPGRQRGAGEAGAAHQHGLQLRQQALRGAGGGPGEEETGDDLRREETADREESSAGAAAQTNPEPEVTPGHGPLRCKVQQSGHEGETETFS